MVVLAAVLLNMDPVQIYLAWQLICGHHHHHHIHCPCRRPHTPPLSKRSFLFRHSYLYMYVQSSCYCQQSRCNLHCHHAGLLQPPSQNLNAVTCTLVHHQPSSQHSLLHLSQQHLISTSLNQAQPIADHLDRLASSTSVQPSSSAINPRIAACRSPCTVQGCQALIAPSMWHSHMQQPAHGIFYGEVPTSWFNKQGLFICSHCSQLASSSRSLSHQRRCCSNFSSQLQSSPTLPSPPVNSLPTMDEVFSQRCPTICFIPSKFRLDFARVLASTLSNILYNNTVESWLKPFMLPKCVLPSAPHCGCHHHPTDIKLLCEAWGCGQFASLWARAKQHASHHGPWSSSPDVDQKRIAEAISLAKDSLLGKACQILTSSGLLPILRIHDQSYQPNIPRVLPQFLLLISHLPFPLKSYHL